jgi:glycosyltransferase involved in cell wall biosynthesis
VRVLILIPVHNEAANLPAVIADVRAHAGDADVVVVDDGSTDETRRVVADLGVRRLALRTRVGVGGAIRTGLRYAVSHGYDVVVRLDGDGQHPAALVGPLIETLHRERADVAVGSRYRARPRPKSVPFVRRLVHYGLGRVLSHLVGQLVTDPTSGLWAFGSRAIVLLAERHPSGYPEAELILVARRLALRMTEVPVEMRERLAGRTSLTLRRSAAAMVRLGVRIAYDAFSRAPHPPMRERAIEDDALGLARQAHEVRPARKVRGVRQVGRAHGTN